MASSARRMSSLRLLPDALFSLSRSSRRASGRLMAILPTRDLQGRYDCSITYQGHRGQASAGRRADAPKRSFAHRSTRRRLGTPPPQSVPPSPPGSRIRRRRAACAPGQSRCAGHRRGRAPTPGTTPRASRCPCPGHSTPARARKAAVPWGHGSTGRHWAGDRHSTTTKSGPMVCSSWHLRVEVQAPDSRISIKDFAENPSRK